MNNNNNNPSNNQQPYQQQHQYNPYQQYQPPIDQQFYGQQPLPYYPMQQYYAGQPQLQVTELEYKIDQLCSMGFTKIGQNRGLLRKCNGNVDQVVKILIQKQGNQEKHKETKGRSISPSLIQKFIQTTKVLIIDCNNVVYALKKWKKDNQFKVKPPKFLKKLNKSILIWALKEESQLQQVYLVWDMLDFNRMFEKIKEKQLMKAELIESSSHKPYKNQLFKLLVQVRKKIHQQIALPTPNGLSIEISIQKSNFAYDLKVFIDICYHFLQIQIMSAIPQYKIADDLIFSLGQSLLDADKMQTTVVTGDMVLRERLSQVGISSFLGGGMWKKISKFNKKHKPELK